MGNKNYSRCAIHTGSIYNVEYFIMSHHAHQEHLERKEEDRLEELAQLQQDHEFLEKLYATEIDSAERIKLIKKHFFGEKNNANDI